MTRRDGARIYVDVLRPAGAANVPVIFAWSPYGKSAGMSPARVALFGMLGIDSRLKSGLEKFEGPDPAYRANTARPSATPIRGVSADQRV